MKQIMASTARRCAFLALLTVAAAYPKLYAQPKNYDAIRSGVPWIDDQGKPVSAHGANIVRDGDRFYLFGEAHSDTSNAFAGFNCYSSPDLYNWKFERVALPVQLKGKLGPNRVGERPKVMKCPLTGEYILYMHADTLGYVDPYIGYAVSKNITGPYEFKGPLLYKGQPIKRWDMGSFQDNDGKGYILVHEGDIYRLSGDYKSVEAQVLAGMADGCESPAVFKKGGLYYWLSSSKTSWERNDNDYYTASSLAGPWTRGGNFAPKGSLTWNSQTTFVLPIIGRSDTTFLFMGDRWSYPRQESAATYVWQPLSFNGRELSLPVFLERWHIDLRSGKSSPAIVPGNEWGPNAAGLSYSGLWTNDATSSQKRADAKGSTCTVTFTGTGITWYGLTEVNGGYAKVSLTTSAGKLIAESLVDMYSKVPLSSPRFASPLLSKGSYRLVIEVLGEHGNWSDKRKNLYGSTGNRVSIEKFIVNPGK